MSGFVAACNMLVLWLLMAAALQAHPLIDCHYKGLVLSEGEAVAVDDLCLDCVCRSGALRCAARVCPVSAPPPAGCALLLGQDQCCPQLHCERDAAAGVSQEAEPTDVTVRGGVARTAQDPPQLNHGVSSGCVVNGSRYGEGSALASSNMCLYCYCISGRQSCVRPQCADPAPGCRPSYRQHTCCPTHYDCGDEKEPKERSATKQRKTGCILEHAWYREGDMMPADGSSPCEMCYCLRGTRRCARISCHGEAPPGCRPVLIASQCCPASYDCSSMKKPYGTNSSNPNDGRSYQEGVDLDIENDIATTTEATTETTATETTTAIELTTTELLDLMEQQTTVDTPTEDSATTVREAEMETTVTTDTSSWGSTWPATEEVGTTERGGEVSLRSRLEVNLTAEQEVTARPQHHPAAAVAAAHNASRLDDDYDSYDYSEPKLPPSLPNLIIFPFVAADAVVKEKESQVRDASYKQSGENSPATVQGQFKDYFLPPSETQGGFVPRDPTVEDGHLKSSSQGGYGSAKQPVPSLTEGEGVLPILETQPSITVPPKPNDGHCLSGGVEYRHGDLVPEPRRCFSCLCSHGEVACQEVACPAVPPGCRRAEGEQGDHCCGRMLCDAATQQPTTTTEEATLTVAATITVAPTMSQDVSNATQATVPQLRREPNPTQSVDETSSTSQETTPLALSNSTAWSDTSNSLTAPTITPEKTGNKTLFENIIKVNVTNMIRKRPTTKRPLVGVKPKNKKKQSTSTTESTTELFFDEFLKDFFATTKDSDFGSTTFRAPITRKHKYSSKVRNSSMHTEYYQKLNEEQIKEALGNDKDSFDNSFSFDSMLKLFFDSEATTLVPPTTARLTTKPKLRNNTRKVSKKPSNRRTTKITTTARPVTRTEPPKETSTSHMRASGEGGAEAAAMAFVAGQDSGLPNINIVHQGGHGKQHSARTPVKTSQDLSSILKLAGCNIYGRMYRVGKIITELSGPCLECMCTELGVECSQLSC